MKSSIGNNLANVNADIQKLESKYKRQSDSIKLLAISKKKSVDDINEAISHGQREFGESYLQEAVNKIMSLNNKELVWHFVGPIQKNKTKQIAEHFDWVHSVDRLIIAERLNTQRPKSSVPIQICIQANIDNEATKSGVPLEHVQNLALDVVKLPNIKLRGLMAIPQAGGDINAQRQRFKQLRELLEKLNELGLNLDTLSMGMSGDLEAAIAEGATIVRVGTSIFGERTSNPHIARDHE